MPSESKRQHGFMGLVYQYKTTGKIPEKLSLATKIKIKKAAQSMSLKQVKDFLKTKVKRLPTRKRKKG